MSYLKSKPVSRVNIQQTCITIHYIYYLNCMLMACRQRISLIKHQRTYTACIRECMWTNGTDREDNDTDNAVQLSNVIKTRSHSARRVVNDREYV